MNRPKTKHLQFGDPVISSFKEDNMTNVPNTPHSQKIIQKWRLPSFKNLKLTDKSSVSIKNESNRRSSSFRKNESQQMERRKFRPKTLSVINNSKKSKKIDQQSVRKVQSDGAIPIKKDINPMYTTLYNILCDTFYNYILGYSTNDFESIENIIYSMIHYNLYEDFLKYCLEKEEKKLFEYKFRDQTMETKCILYFIDWKYLQFDYYMKDMFRKINKIIKKGNFEHVKIEEADSHIDIVKIFEYIKVYLKYLPNHIHYILNMIKKITNDHTIKDDKEDDNEGDKNGNILIVVLYLRIIIPTIIGTSHNNAKVIKIMTICLKIVNEICGGSDQHKKIKTIIDNGISTIKHIGISDNLFEYRGKDQEKLNDADKFLQNNIGKF